MQWLAARLVSWFGAKSFCHFYLGGRAGATRAAPDAESAAGGAKRLQTFGPIRRARGETSSRLFLTGLTSCTASDLPGGVLNLGH